MTPGSEARIGDLPFRELLSRCAGGGIRLDYGAATVSVQCSIPGFVEDLALVYRNFKPAPLRDSFSDYHVVLKRSGGFRRIFRPQCHFSIDNLEPFAPFPLSSGLPLFEWGVNWSFAHRGNQYLQLHSGALASNDRAVIMAAPPGSGKSTLAAAMMLTGFRLLSDEFGVLSPETGCFLPMLKPIALKNQSVEVIRTFSKEAVIGPLYTGTRKGDVAHLAPNEASVGAAARSARPELIVFPAFEAGAKLKAHRVPDEEAFARLAFNSFNYHLLGPIGFDAVARVIESCPAYQLRYSALDQAIEWIRERLLETGTKS